MRSVHELAADLVMLLMKEPRTIPQMGVITGCKYDTVKRYTAEFHKAGLVYVKGRCGERRRGKPPAVYAWNPDPGCVMADNYRVIPSGRFDLGRVL